MPAPWPEAWAQSIVMLYSQSRDPPASDVPSLLTALPFASVNGGMFCSTQCAAVMIQCFAMKVTETIASVIDEASVQGEPHVDAPGGQR